MKKILFVMILLINSSWTLSQNLVPNGDFEQYSTCPNNQHQIARALPWFSANTATPDYFNSCTTYSAVDVPSNSLGYQVARSGVGYAGIIPFSEGSGWKEYIEVELTSPLIANNCYRLEFYINLGNYSQFNASEIAACFTDTVINVTGVYYIPMIPQITSPLGIFPDTVGWMQVSGNYTAVGGESYLTIGIFKDNANVDTVIVNPLFLAPYVYFYIDDVSLSLCTGLNESPENFFNVFPNPANDHINLQFNDGGQPFDSFSIYDITGRLCIQTEHPPSNLKLDIQELNAGVYIATVRRGADTGHLKFIKN